MIIATAASAFPRDGLKSLRGINFEVKKKIDDPAFH
jgi:hypothetical protein